MSKKSSQRHAQPARPPWWLAAIMVAGGLLILGLTAWLAWPRPAATSAIEVRGAPKLKVDAEVVDLGPVTLGKWVSARFTLTNVGDQPLRFAGDPYIEVVEGC